MMELIKPGFQPLLQLCLKGEKRKSEKKRKITAEKGKGEERKKKVSCVNDHLHLHSPFAFGGMHVDTGSRSFFNGWSKVFNFEKALPVPAGFQESSKKPSVRTPNDRLVRQLHFINYNILVSSQFPLAVTSNFSKSMHHRSNSISSMPTKCEECERIISPKMQRACHLCDG